MSDSNEPIITSEALLFFDVETGGLTPEHTSLLSIGLLAWSPTDGILDTLHIKVKEPILKVTEVALEINQIDLLEHFRNAVTFPEAREEIIHFATKHIIPLAVVAGEQKYPKVKLAGWNIGSFDLKFLSYFFDQLNQARLHRTVFDYHVVDLPGIMRLLYDSGKLSKDFSSSSDQALEHFAIERLEPHNNPVNCCIATCKLYEQAISLLK